jgi:hypothetical protein
MPSHQLKPLFVAPLGISSAPTKQRGKKQGKGTVKSSNGFASVSYGNACTPLISGFTNRKDVGCGYQESSERRPTAPFRIAF